MVHGRTRRTMPPCTSAKGFSAVLIGEVEATLLELAQGRRLPESTALCMGTGRHSLQSRRARWKESGFSAFARLGPDRHPTISTGMVSRHSYFSLNMVSSRGCPFRCNWCAKPIYGNSYHARSPRAVAAEMLH